MSFFHIIIATHDRPALLARTLQSLLAQTFTDFTVTVVSDSLTYAPPFRELTQLKGRCNHVIRATGDAGPAASRNMGLDLAQGRYVIFIDDDDTFEPTHLAHVHQAITAAEAQADAESCIFFCDCKACYENRSVQPPSIYAVLPVPLGNTRLEDIYVKNTLPNSCLVFPQATIGAHRFDPDLDLYEDWDFLLRCLPGQRLQHVPIDSVTIHKTVERDAVNLRRGVSGENLVVPTTLELYRRYPAPSADVAQARIDLFASVGLSLPSGG